MGILQNEDFKTEAELISAGGAKTQLLNDAKIYIASNSITETLDDAITNNKLYKTTSAPVGLTDTQSLTNKSLEADTTLIYDQTGPTKKAKFVASSITAGQTRNITIPDSDLTLLGTTTSQVITGKTFDDALLVKQITTPASPSAGYNKIYPKSDNKWYGVTSGGVETLVGGSAGGSSIIWRNDDNYACEEVTNYGQLNYVFSTNYDQYVWTAIKVPNSYIAGKQITIKAKMYCPTAGSATILLLAQSTLIRSATDALSVTTNQRTTTNTAVAIATANLEYIVDWDIVSTIGQINAVAISANDTILVKVYRSTDTNTDLAYFMPSTTELIIAQ